jgi:hypothetical protein
MVKEGNGGRKKGDGRGMEGGWRTQAREEWLWHSVQWHKGPPGGIHRGASAAVGYCRKIPPV